MLIVQYFIGSIECVHSIYTQIYTYSNTYTHTLRILIDAHIHYVYYTHIYTHIPSLSGKASGSYETVFWSSSGTPKAVYISLVNPLYVI